MKKKIINSFCYLLLGVTLITSCKKEEMLPINNNPNPTAQQNDGMIVLGEQLEDPYSIENMKKAYASLRTRGDAPDIDITPTHTYIRLLPKDETEWGVLKSDTTIHIYDYPLNFEIQNIGTYYHDPSLPDSSITWQYCVLPINYAIPNIQHEKIYDVFIPEEADSTRLKSGINLNEFYAELELESVKLTGNLPEGGTRIEKASKWTPKGKIRVYDDYLGLVPVVGANVHARWFTRVESKLTDGSGNFTMPQFRYEVNYSIKWERQDFDIREEDWGQAWFNGPKQKSDWNLDISSGKSLRYATIHRAAHQYYYENIGGIKRPPLNKWYKRAMKIGYYHRKAKKEINGDANPYWPQWYTWPDLRIFGENTYGWRNTRDIYSTTIHELAHASHWDLSGKTTFNKTENKVTESWARGVQWWLTRKVYTGYSPDYFEDYSGIVEDMVDGINGYDQVSGYTMKELEDALNEQKTWSNWRDNIKNKYNNGTESKIDELFSHW
jgi:hypothetical protein